MLRRLKQIHLSDVHNQKTLVKTCKTGRIGSFWLFNQCKIKETCAACGQVGHTSYDCTNEPKCPNCTGNHSAFNKSCPKWIFEKKVQQVKAERGIWFIEARKIVSAESESRPAQGCRTTAAVVASKSSPTQPATRSIEVQTDLTWPKGQKEPSALLSSASSTSHLTQTTTDKFLSNNVGKRQSSQSPPYPSSSNKKQFQCTSRQTTWLKRPRGLNSPGLPNLILKFERAINITRWRWRLMTAALQNQISQILVHNHSRKYIIVEHTWLVGQQRGTRHSFISHSSYYCLPPGDLPKGN